jgi:hypothetical protein
MEHVPAIAVQENCHLNTDENCCCDSDVGLCKCAMQMTFSVFIQNATDILSHLSSSGFPLYIMNYIKHDSTPLLRPPIA